MKRDVAPSKRISIPHLENLNDVVFVNLMLSVWFDAKFSLKVDGCSGRFGVDNSGIPFFETGRSGPLYTPGQFEEYARSNVFSQERIYRASLYDEIFKLIVESEVIQRIPRNTKVLCELLYRPMGIDHGRFIKFVTIPYLKDGLGDPLTIIPYSVVYADSGKNHEHASYILPGLHIIDDSKIKFISPTILTKAAFNFTPYSSMIKNIIPDNWEEILTSRKIIHRDVKVNLKSEILQIKRILSESLLEFLLDKSPKLGYTNEGLVCEVNGISFKVVTNAYKIMRTSGVYC